MNEMQENKSFIDKLLDLDQKKTGTKTIIYGDAGIGKTTCCYNIPAKKLLFINLEGGIGNLKFDNKTKLLTQSNLTALDVIGLLHDLRDFPTHGITTIVIDSLTKLEQLIQERVCKAQKNPVEFISDIGFGKGHDQCKKEFLNILKCFDELTLQGINIVLIAHSKIETNKNPMGEDFIYLDIAMHKTIREVLIPAMDTIAYLTINPNIKDGKVSNTQTRVLKVDSNLSYLSKNRSGINTPIAIDDYKSLLG